MLHDACAVERAVYSAPSVERGRHRVAAKAGRRSLNLIKEVPCTVLIVNSELRREASSSDGGLGGAGRGWGGLWGR